MTILRGAAAAAVRAASCGGLAIGFAMATTAPVQAQSLMEALALAYQTNPSLAAGVDALRATNEQIAQAQSGFRPNVEASADIGIASQDLERPGQADTDETTNPRSIGIDIVQPLYRGGRTLADIERARNTIQAQRANLTATEQQVLLDAATAYMNVVRERSVLDLNINNENVLDRQLQAARDRFDVGEVTRTDVSQAISRLSRATSARISAEGTLASSTATYERVIGAMPGNLSFPDMIPMIPTSLDEAIALAEEGNPAVTLAEFTERAAQASIDLTEGELLPTVNLVGSARRALDGSSDGSRSTSASVTAQVTVPLYQSGSVYSRVRQSKHVANQRRVQIEESRRSAIEQAISAWEGLQAAQARTESFVREVEATRVALDGVQQEALVGSRTVLDVLDAEQEFLDAQVNLVSARRDEVVAAFQLLSSVGQLTAADLELAVDLYDVEADYQRADGRWIGTGIDSTR